MLDFRGKRVTVMGLGRFGGGIGVTRWLVSRGADVLVTDLDPAEELGDSVAKIQDLVDSGAVTLRLGEHNVSDFTTCDCVIANAAVAKPRENRFLRAAEAAAIPITTEIVLMIENLPAGVRARTIAVTGSAGKSTTTSMIHHALNELSGYPHAPRGAIIGGNIGGSLLGRDGEIGGKTWLVLELSSAQLYWIDRVLGATAPWSPHIAVVTNISSNHIDWHGSFDHYADSKRTLIKRLEPADSAILGENAWSWRESTKARCTMVDPGTITTQLKLPGEHNRVNAAAALAAIHAALPELDPREVERAIAAFPGLAHRLQLVVETKLDSGGEPVRFYNDSKSTTPDSALKAIEAVAAVPGFSRSRVHLIAGGYNKGSDLSPIAAAASELAGVYTIGDTGPTIANAAGGERSRAFACGTLEAAVQRAMLRLKPGDALLLSPGCASWDQYTNFEERGEEFVRLVRKAVGA